MTHPYRIPHYPNDTDYTTNAASYYDDLARKNALMKHLAHRIWEYDKELAKRFLQWEENLATINEDVKKMLEDWMDDGTLAHIINEQLFGELQQEISGFIESYDRMTKEVNLKNAKNQYLFDLELTQATINQGLHVDEIGNQLFASQVLKVDNDLLESYRINRLSMSGVNLDSMIIRLGGHGTSFGIEYENGVPYIWTNIMDGNPDGSIRTQYLARVKYQAGKTTSFHDADMEKMIEFPNSQYYQSPITDTTNGLIALRITDSSGAVKHKVEVYKFADLKQGRQNKLYDFTFTPEMNARDLQGIAFDDFRFYVSVGNNVHNFSIYEADMRTGEVVAEVTAKDLGMEQHNGQYEHGMSEPEGLSVYRDPKTGEKTLLHVIISSETGSRRNRLYGISGNNGLSKFQGYANQNAQLVPLTHGDGKGKRITATVGLIANVRKPGYYYMTSDATISLPDHPMPGVAGWFVHVSGADTGGGVIQSMRRNSSIAATEFSRFVSGEGVALPWEGKPVKPDLMNGYKPYYEDLNHEPQYYRVGNTLYIAGMAGKSSQMLTGEFIFILPPGYRPNVRQEFPVYSENGYSTLVVNTAGEVFIGNILFGEMNPGFIHLNVTVPLN